MEKQVGEGGRERKMWGEGGRWWDLISKGDPTMIPKLRGQRSYILIHFYLKMKQIDLSKSISFFC